MANSTYLHSIQSPHHLLLPSKEAVACQAHGIIMICVVCIPHDAHAIARLARACTHLPACLTELLPQNLGAPHLIYLLHTAAQQTLQSSAKQARIARECKPWPLH